MSPASAKWRVGRGEHCSARIPMLGDERIEALDGEKTMSSGSFRKGA